MSSECEPNPCLLCVPLSGTATCGYVWCRACVVIARCLVGRLTCFCQRVPRPVARVGLCRVPQTDSSLPLQDIYVPEAGATQLTHCASETAIDRHHTIATTFLPQYTSTHAQHTLPGCSHALVHSCLRAPALTRAKEAPPANCPSHCKVA